MDSEVVTNANEIMSTQQQVVKDEFEKSEPGSEIVRDETDVKIAESKADGVVENGDTTTATAIVTIRKDNAIREEETDADPQIEAETTTIVVTKTENESAHIPDKESESSRETTITAIVLKNEKEATETSDKESESATTTTAIFVLPNKEEIRTDKAELESNPKADVPSNAKNTAIEALVEDDNEGKEAVVADADEETDEYDEEEDESVDDDDGEDLKTGTKTEEIEDEQGQSNIPEKSEVAKATKINQDENAAKANKDINNQIENIISDIDINIKAQEKITQLKEQELQLIQKQKDLANQIQQQQLLAQKLIAENQLKEQELQRQKYLQQQQLQQQQRLLQQQQSHHQYEEEIEPLIKKDQCNTAMFQHQADSTKLQESSNNSRTVDLRKIFTPATDAPQILPKNRKLYASSAFYSPTLHPTVEDQVELARRISHSLSDISNQTSKGQTMYVNRKKRSVKWVHEGCGQGEDGDIIETHSLSKENTVDDLLQPELIKLDKMPLKLVMNPRGQMRDYNSLKESINIESGLLSPDNCAELITALQLHKGRGAELFAKRRRKADNWVVDETNAGTHSPSGIPDYQQYQTNRPSVTSPSIVPAYSDAGKHRVQLNLHQDRLIEKYSKCGVQVVKSPWEAALQTGSASTAFLDQSEFQSQTPIASQPSPVHFTQDFTDSPSLPASYTNPSDYAQDTYKSSPYEPRGKSQPIQSSNPQRELAYKPSVAQGWGGRNVELPKGLYVPKEISLASYAPPPVQPTHNLLSSPKSVEYEGPPYAGFSVANTKSGLYNSVPPKQQLYNPTSYQKVPSSSQQAGLQVNYSPSPLSYNKLSKFQESAEQRNQRYLNVKKQPAYRGVQNVSPTPFLSDGAGGHDNRLPYNVESQQIWRGGNQSFNSCARGWNKETNNIKRNVYCPKTVSIPATENLPYSDF